MSLDKRLHDIEEMVERHDWPRVHVHWDDGTCDEEPCPTREEREGGVDMVRRVRLSWEPLK